MKGFIAPTDHGWWQFLRARSDLEEVNFWRPGTKRFVALQPGEPFFFRLKSPHNVIGGFGLFARYAQLPVWRVWEVFGQANGATDEGGLLDRVKRLARHPVRFSDPIGCIAITACTFFEPDEWVPVPSDYKTHTVSGALTDLNATEGQWLWRSCLERAALRPQAPAWLAETADQVRNGTPQLVAPRLGQGSFRIAVLDAYGGACAVTGEHSLPALEAAHIRPWSAGGGHELSNGLPLRRDLHRLFDLGYVSARRDGSLLVSPRLRTEFASGRTYYALEGQQLLSPADPGARPSSDLLEWHSEAVFQAS